MWLDEQAKQILIDLAEKTIRAAKANLPQDSELKKSIGYTYSDKDSKLSIFMNEYGWYLDRGVTGAGRSDFKGKRKTVHRSLGRFKFSGGKQAIGGSKEIDKWMQKNNISDPNISQKSLNFLIRRSIYQHGIKPTLFLTKPFDIYKEQIAHQFEALEGDIEKYISKDINNLK